MRAMLSFTICGGLDMPCARTVGACMASASPIAVVRVDAASTRCFMAFTSSGLRLGLRLTMGGSTVGAKGYRAAAKFSSIERPTAGVIHGPKSTPQENASTRLTFPDDESTTHTFHTADARRGGVCRWDAQCRRA